MLDPVLLEHELARNVGFLPIVRSELQCGSEGLLRNREMSYNPRSISSGTCDIVVPGDPSSDEGIDGHVIFLSASEVVAEDCLEQEDQC